MIVGILSDTHGKTDMAHLAVQTLIGQGAEYLVHCGDVGGKEVLDALAGHPAMFVFGNNDYDRDELENYAKILGIACGGEHGKLAFGGKLAVVTHGDDHRLLRKLLEQQKIDYLFVGHTHEKLDRREGRVRMINPGALYRAAVKSVALLDTARDQLRFITIAE
jgi:putative phosphoesterase